MSVRLLLNNSVPASSSPYRLVDDRNREIAWANEFLDAQKLRQLSVRSPRISRKPNNPPTAPARAATTSARSATTARVRREERHTAISSSSMPWTPRRISDLV